LPKVVVVLEQLTKAILLMLLEKAHFQCPLIEVMGLG
jgi:hypothetical protein